MKNKSNLKIARLKINSVRYKLASLQQVLRKWLIDILFVQETKLDDSFPLAQFNVPVFVVFRKYVRYKCGGITAQIWSDLPQRRRIDVEEYGVSSSRIECLVIEIMIKNDKFQSLIPY